MDKLRITGGRPLEGELAVSGAKNAALPIMCASLLTAEPLRLANVPRLMDVSTMAKLLAQIEQQVRPLDEGPQRAGTPHLRAVRARIQPSPDAVEILVDEARVARLGPIETGKGGNIGERQDQGAAARPQATREQRIHDNGAGDLVAMGERLQRHARARGVRGESPDVRDPRVSCRPARDVGKRDVDRRCLATDGDRRAARRGAFRWER